MSQAGSIGGSSGPVPPTVATSYVTDNGTAVPAANILLVDGKTSTENNTNGVITKGGVAGTGTANEVDIVLTNRITGSATTTNAVTPVTVFTFSLGATPATYLFTINIVAYNVTSSLSAGYVDFATVRTTGAAGSLISNSPSVISEEGVMNGVIVTPTISGNNLELDVIGLAASTIDWLALVTYIKVS